MKIIFTLIFFIFTVNTLAQGTDPNLEAVNNEADTSQVESEILSFLEPYIYDTEGRRDPFLEYKVFVPTQSVGSEVEFDSSSMDDEINKQINSSSSPLARYNLNQLKLKAILWSVKSPRIIIKDPDDKLHTLRMNDKLGNNGGYIAAIREGEVVIVQKTSVQGKLITSTKFLRLIR